MVEPVIHAEDLVKAYEVPGERDFIAVDGLSFDVEPGESFGLLGPDGSGKSTVMRMVAAVSSRTGGRLSVLGLEPDDHAPEIRSRLGIVPQQDTLDVELTGREALVTHVRLFGVPPRIGLRRARALLTAEGLEDTMKRTIEDLDAGVRRRLAIARALVNEPRILLVDSPGEGLDATDRAAVHGALSRIRETGMTILLGTRDAEEAEKLCDRVALVDGGRVLAAGHPDALVREHTSREVLELRFGVGRTMQAARQLFGIGDRLATLADRVLVYADNGERVWAGVVERGLQPASSLVRRSNLDDVFLRLTGRTLAA
ncbi:ABC transporter ATP-binding protein [Microbacterium sp. X-17]|uniref:ABC transporter ATP-binding protein n=1 Tax=Microbacterium sp. X-17 TaxID=3144404 RepID=UPI0031F5113D